MPTRASRSTWPPSTSVPPTSVTPKDRKVAKSTREAGGESLRPLLLAPDLTPYRGRLLGEEGARAVGSPKLRHSYTLARVVDAHWQSPDPCHSDPRRNLALRQRCLSQRQRANG